MHLDRAACDRARHTRDARFDGRFFIGVTTTRIYCRPVCPARAPKDEHVRYFPTAAAAEAAGFRPCLRCRPEVAPGSAAWLGTSSVVRRALHLIDDGACDDGGVEALAARLGVTGRHLRRLFDTHVGASPQQVATTRRVQLAKQLIDGTDLSMATVAFAAGFRSVRQFNGVVRQTYGRAPSALRRRRLDAHGDAGAYLVQLAVRAPYDWGHVCQFLAARATAGVEQVTPDAYRRTVAVPGGAGVITVRPDPSGRSLRLQARLPHPAPLLGIVTRTRHLFDVGADPLAIGTQLAADPRLAPWVAAWPGVRVPGAWDAFEVIVRAILGQQVSVAAATTLAGRVARAFGTPLDGADGLDRLFPTAAQLADAALEPLGVIGSRARAIRTVARLVADGAMPLDGERDALVKALRGVAGIGAWTAEYVAMRALPDPDAFPSGDLVLRRACGGTPAQLERLSQAWRPWRAYAVMLLWRAAAARPVEVSDDDLDGSRTARRARRHAGVDAPAGAC
jgi:AraC family transcriptional regulator of adaptative response / DNA-3-methyladenine glycosylase II